MKVSILFLHCLNCLSDDRESVTGILADVRSATHSDVTPEEIAACLEDLVAEGLVSRSIDGSGTDWFELTAKGKQELDANWVDA